MRLWSAVSGFPVVLGVLSAGSVSTPWRVALPVESLVSYPFFDSSQVQGVWNWCVVIQRGHSAWITKFAAELGRLGHVRVCSGE